MAEKRRGLGRGLGALIPSAPPEEVAQPEPEPEPAPRQPAAASDTSKKLGGRPVDLFFERVTEEDVAEQPRSYSSALRTGINKNVLDAQTKRVGKTASRKSSTSDPSAEPPSRTRPSRAPGGDSSADDPTSPEGGLSSIGPSEESPESTGPRPDPEDTPAAESIASTDAASVSRETTDIAASESGPAQADFDGLLPVPGATFAELPLDSIHPNRKQPRVEFNEDELSELVHSIREIGVLQPVVVRPSHEGGQPAYELVMGERRWRASREAGMSSIPAIIRSTLDDDLLRDALLENLHRSALNPLEEAAAYQQLLDDFGCSHDELAGRLGRSRPQISNTLRLMKLPPLVQRRVAAGVLSAGHARALLGLGDPAEMEKLAQRIVAEGLSVRSTEEIVALSGGLRRASKPSSPRDGARHERLDYLATSLSDRLDTNVKITLGAKKGRVSIEFASVDDLNRIVGVLSPAKD
ncbi:ParB/RepB/Spo0J family partition protein [Arthrobacter sp. B0490]|uniref:ParB/RepB/Spo0J family partition protein n=1 Tax=Arthrobacter sp. B0490 TaxID=2058891 RepID=UPI0015E41613|nr:ParB/RepB/Spo0J family partition protein [Arthrobacter sp. B0490]